MKIRSLITLSLIGWLLTACFPSLQNQAIVSTSPTLTVKPSTAPTDNAQPPTATMPATTITPVRTSTPAHTPNKTPPPCSQANLITDITIPDGTIIQAGEILLKIWQLRNTGSCTWKHTQYQLEFAHGERLSGPTTAQAYFYHPGSLLELSQFGNSDWKNILGEVPPGEVANVPLLLKAPQQPGIYYSYWHLQDTQSNTAATLWAAIIVETEAEAETETPLPQTDWSGEWLHINTWFTAPDAPPGRLVLQQTQNKLSGYFYTKNNQQSGAYPVIDQNGADLVIVEGTISEDQQQAEGFFSLAWGEAMPFRWQMSPNFNQFEGVANPGADDSGFWCGGRGGLAPPTRSPQDDSGRY
ncbi:MAG: NBR1-Ig-like domain-containing protein [Chloroflexota bacterium]|nr:NBR1-Ig-like domain-containing protein [Chloroflexota bacterium]